MLRHFPQSRHSVEPPHADKFGIIACGSYAAVDNWIKRLRKHFGLNYFVRFLDVRGPALQYGYASWAHFETMNGYYVIH